MSDPQKLVLFSLDAGSFALRLSSVERIVPIVAITPLPKAPRIVSGVVNIRGSVIPIFDIRMRFGLPGRDPALSDQIILADTGKRRVGLVVDEVTGVAEFAGEVTPSEEILPDVEYFDGVVRLEDGIAFIHNLATFLSLDEERSLDEAMKGRADA